VSRRDERAGSEATREPRRVAVDGPEAPSSAVGLRVRVLPHDGVVLGAAERDPVLVRRGGGGTSGTERVGVGGVRRLREVTERPGVYARGDALLEVDGVSVAGLLDALADLGTAHVGLLAEELDRDPSTVSHHLQRLADDELVVRERDGRAVVNRLADDELVVRERDGRAVVNRLADPVADTVARRRDSQPSPTTDPSSRLLTRGADFW
jgi:DNA-binding transcriptional ArsR family regulator